MEHIKVFENFDPAYSEMVDRVIPLNDAGEVMSEADDLCRRHKWEPDFVLAVCYRMLVEINEHDLAKKFVAMVDEGNK
jgi:hypothetical protein